MNVDNNMSSIPIGISLPIELVMKIDKERHDVSRSRYILRLIEKNVRNNVVVGGGVST
jgi:metal-responsive CopG/Arc/MetJ family transcriptional regulator